MYRPFRAQPVTRTDPRALPWAVMLRPFGAGLAKILSKRLVYKDKHSARERKIKRGARMNLCGRAELIRALDEIGEGILDTAAELAGFEKIPEEIAPRTGEEKQVGASWTFFQREVSTAESKEEALNIRFWRVVECEYNQAVLSGETQQEAPVSFVRWKNPPEKPPEFIPLSKWTQLLPYLRKYAMAKVSGSQLDLRRIVRRLSKGELLQDLPRRPRLAWGAQVQVVLDRSDRLIPYWNDQEAVAAQLLSLLPMETYEIAFCWEGTQEPVFADRRDYQIPAPGGLVLVLGDLGMLAEDEATRRSWQQFGESLACGGCRAVVLFPCGQCADIQNPPWIVLPWERLSSSSPVMGKGWGEDEQEYLLTLLSPAIRIEPGLLRNIRRWQNLDAAVESLFWQHPALRGTSSVAATIDPVRAKEEYRKKFDDDDFLPKHIRLEVLRRIREWRYQIQDEVWFEECALNPGVHRLLTEAPQPDESVEIQVLRQDVQQAEQFFQYLGQDFITGASDAGDRHWYRRMEKRIPAPEAHTEKLRPALNRMWHVVHHGEPNVKHPAGYNPADIPSQAHSRQAKK